MVEVHDKYIHTSEVHNLTSPKIIVPFLLDHLHPKSVVDVGCGTGTFLKVFQDHGVQDVIGIDGNWVDRKRLFISEELFMEADLEKQVALERQFDVVLCLEVAEHLHPSASETIIDTLVSLGKIIVFSAAVPNQGGQNHINEQPIAFWQKAFAKRGYVFFDLFRKPFWNITEMEWWYKQNMFLVAHQSISFSENINSTRTDGDVDIHIHPDLLKMHVRQKERTLFRLQNQKKALKSFSSGNEALPLYGVMLFRKIRNLVLNKGKKQL